MSGVQRIVPFQPPGRYGLVGLCWKSISVTAYQQALTRAYSAQPGAWFTTQNQYAGSRSGLKWISQSILQQQRHLLPS